MSDLGQQFLSSIDRERLVSRLQTLVRTPSENPPGDEATVAKLVRGYCEDLGFEVEDHEFDPGRPSVVARLRRGDGPTLTYCSHIDVVPAGDHALWERPPYGGDIEEGILYGRGACDAKAPIAAALEAAAVLQESGYEWGGTLELALVADEEAGGYRGAAELVGQGICSPDICIVGEPTSLKVVIAQRGVFWTSLTAKGRAAHGSAPERGINAIKHIAEIVLRLEETIPDIEHPILGRPSINVGTVRGGEKVNIIPATCVIEIDRRTLPGETRESILESLEAAVELARKRYPEIDTTFVVNQHGFPFEMDPQSPVVRHAVSAVDQVTGAPAEMVGFRGASDARFFAAAGADTVVWGPGDITVAHTAREFVDLGEVERCATAYAVAFAGLLQPGGAAG